MRLLPLLAASLTSLSVASAGIIQPAGVTASSTYTETTGYTADKVMDGKAGSSWVEGDKGSGLGASLDFDLGGEKKILGFKVWAGDWYDHASWSAANRPKELEFKFGDGSVETMKLTDEMVAQEFRLPAGKTSDKVRVRIKSVHNGSTWFDTPISEVQIFAEGDALGLAVKQATSSSNLEPDGDGNYEPANLSDRLLDSMWCEGNKEGDGVGEWVELTFKAKKSVSSVTLVNGIGSALGVWMKGNRATGAKLGFSDGTSHPIEIKGTMRPQTIEFPSKDTSSVRITFTGVTKGREYNDLCISEAYFQ